MNWTCKNCKSENPGYRDSCIRCECARDFDPDSDTKVLDPVSLREIDVQKAIQELIKDIDDHKLPPQKS